MTTRGHGHGHANERGHGHGDGGTKTEREHDGGTRAHGGTQAEGDTLPDVVVATSEGGVVALGGGDGAVAWRHDLGALAAVGAYGDADGDGRQEVYATARDARLRAIDAATGEVEWTTALTDRAVQMTPPPVAGDVDGDGDAELVVATNDGRVLVVAPEDGRVLASYRRDAAVYTHATLADTDGDGTDEIYVTYGDGRVVALAFLV